MAALSELHHDAMTEAFNVGMGSAGAALSEMVGEEVQLSVPYLSVLSRQEAADLLGRKVSGEVSGALQRFAGSFSGLAMLLFPEDKSLSMVRLLLRDAVPLEGLTEFEEEALLEIGNIILNAGLSSLADLFQSEISSDIPCFMQGAPNDVLRGCGDCSASELLDQVVFLRVDFRLESHAVDGYVIFLLEVQGSRGLADNIERYLQRMLP